MGLKNSPKITRKIDKSSLLCVLLTLTLVFGNRGWDREGSLKEFQETGCFQCS